MSDVGRWLKDLGLDRYTGVFAENDIDLEVLPYLSDQDLKELGLSLGHRRKLLAAVKGLAAAAREEERGAGSAAATPSPDASAERRHLTVMFCDLVGSTAMSSGLDPEDMREVILAYQAVVTSEIERMKGHVAKFMGDGVLAYFGYPQAHEDDPERAVRCGLAIVVAVGGLANPSGKALAARIGIATGLVVVGDPIGEGESRERSVVGATPNLAARLQDLAKSGSVVVAPSTRRLLGDIFDLADLGCHEIKGIVEPVRVWQVLGESRAESRFQALHGAALAPLVGRDEELGLLLSRWRRAKEGEGQLVLLCGEAGIGKSRIAEALLERVAGEAHTRLRYYGSPYHTGSALHPVIRQLERAAALSAVDSSGEKLDKLERLLAQASSSAAAAAPLIAALLSIPAGDRYPRLDLTPQARKSKTFDALVEQMEGLAASQPVLMILEDAHWLDPTTSELFGLLIDRLQSLPVLLMVTFRPVFEPPWTSHAANVTALTIGRLARDQAAEIVERIAAGKKLPTEVQERILVKTDGVPLFVEELTKAILESDLLLDAGDHYETTGPLPALAIPATLHDSLMSRIDRLGPVKEIAQIGAVIGREFTFELLAAVAPLGESGLQDALDQLVGWELVVRRGRPPETAYGFKHALVQNTAYQSLLKSKRQQLHARIAQVLEERFPETVESEPELLAYHYTGALLTERAIGYWDKAGELAMRRSANAEAVRHFSEALRLISALPDSAERARKELGVQTSLGVALIAAEGPGSAQATKAYRRAWELCQETPESPAHFAALWGLWRITRDLKKTGELADLLLDLAERQGETDLKLQAHHAKWATLLNVADLSDCRRHIEQGIALYRPARHKAHAFVYGAHDPVVCGLGHDALALWLLGYPDQGAKRAEEVLALARGLSHPPSLAHALNYATMYHHCAGRIEALRRLTDEMIALSDEQGFPEYRARGMVLRGWITAQEGRCDPALEQIEEGLAAALATTRGGEAPYLMSVKAYVLRRFDRYKKAREVLEGALAEGEAIGERQWEPELHRLIGECLLMQAGRNPDEAIGRFTEALRITREQHAKSLELRAATNLASLWHERGERGTAREVLAPVYDWFTEGFETPDLKRAQELLQDLT